MPVYEKFLPEQVIEAIQNTRGMVSLAARHLGCEADTVRNYAKRYPQVAAAIKEERESVKDIAELVLFKKIQEGEPWAVCFFLKTQARDRGYVERQELTGADGGPVEFILGLRQAWERQQARLGNGDATRALAEGDGTYTRGSG
mgnify:CR=1 FL=1